MSVLAAKRPHLLLKKILLGYWDNTFDPACVVLDRKINDAFFFSGVLVTSEKPDGSKDKQAKLKQQMLNLEDKENL